MFLGLRRALGVDNRSFTKKYGVSMYELYKREIQDLLQKGWIEKQNERIFLTKDGMMFGNDVFASFLLDEQTYKKVFNN